MYRIGKIGVYGTTKEKKELQNLVGFTLSKRDKKKCTAKMYIRDILRDKTLLDYVILQLFQ